MTTNKMYIGDSVYVELEHGMLKLTTNNGYPDDPRNVIYLESSVYHSLTRFVSHISESDLPAEEVLETDEGAATA